jgi:F0F1-type ATP synthase membrane subunit a
MIEMLCSQLNDSVQGIMKENLGENKKVVFCFVLFCFVLFCFVFFSYYSLWSFAQGRNLEAGADAEATEDAAH